MTMKSESRSWGAARTTGFALLAWAMISLTAQTAGAAITNSPTASALAAMVQPSKRLPFPEVILATTGHRVLDFDTNNPAHSELRRQILQAAALVGERARRQGIVTTRANEAGNHLEPIVRQALKDAGLEARVPVTGAGRAQVAGYPDIEIAGATPCYLELKTYNAATADTTQRSFYYSPSATPKVTRDALHLLLAFEMEAVTRDGQSVLMPGHWKLITLQHLEVDLKFEFNQSNRGLYGDRAAVLSEGELR
jgi:hypothetical protein